MVFPALKIFRRLGEQLLRRCLAGRSGGNNNDKEAQQKAQQGLDVGTLPISKMALGITILQDVNVHHDGLRICSAQLPLNVFEGVAELRFGEVGIAPCDAVGVGRTFIRVVRACDNLGEGDAGEGFRQNLLNA